MSIGRHFFIGIPGHAIDATTRQLLKSIEPGGVILFGRNVRSAKQLAELTRSLRKLLGDRLLICLDHEGGRVNRLKDIIGAVPSALQLGFMGCKEWARQHGQLTGRILQKLGVNVNLAPVLDLHLRPKTDNSVPDRCWSANPDEVVRLAGAFLVGMQQQGVIGCGKHFLGYGAADKDPHILLPRVNRSRNQILKEDLLPYSSLAPAGKPRGTAADARYLHMIMLSHAHLTAFHKNRITPACVSAEIVGGLLREKLAFNGVAVTDDLEMGAITRTMSLSQATIRCLQAGADLILICHTARAMREGFRAAVQASRRKLIHPSILEESSERIEQLKSLLAPSPVFSEKRFNNIVEEMRHFTKKVFRALPPRLRVVDARWGAIGEKY